MEISTFSPALSLPTFHKPALISSPSSFSLNPNTALSRSTQLGLKAHTRPRSPPRKGLICNSLFGLGVPELAVIAGVAALVFGPKKLPEIGRGFGKTIKSFQQAAKEFEQELKKPEESESSDSAIEAKPASESPEDKKDVVSSSKESS